MKQSVSLVTLGISDYARARAFYEAMGWSPALDIQETVFFQANGVVLVLWARDKLADDMGIPDDGARVGRHRPGAQRPLAAKRCTGSSS